MKDKDTRLKKGQYRSTRIYFRKLENELSCFQYNNYKRMHGEPVPRYGTIDRVRDRNKRFRTNVAERNE